MDVLYARTRPHLATKDAGRKVVLESTLANGVGPECRSGEIPGATPPALAAYSRDITLQAASHDPRQERTPRHPRDSRPHRR